MKRNSVYLFVITSGFYGPARGCNLRKHQQAVSNSKVSKRAVPKTHRWKEFIIKNKKKEKMSLVDGFEVKVPKLEFYSAINTSFLYD